MQFRRPLLSLNGHRETLFPKKKPTFQANLLTAARLPLSETNELWVRHTPLKPKLLVVLHGLGGDWDSAENLWALDGAQRAGWSCAQVRWARTPPTHAGQKEHLEAVLSFLEKQYKFEKVYVLGFSLGASVMLNWARGKGCERVQKLIAVSAPLDLESASKRLRRGFSKLYDFRFNRILHKWHPEARVTPLMSIFEIDEHFTAPTHGFRDRDDYYKSCSALNFLDEIQIPQVYVVAKNDPLIDIEFYYGLEKSPTRHLVITEGGGHAGYGHWMSDLVFDLLD
jgi:predicted alpha/beta-fold hydrolase